MIQIDVISLIVGFVLGFATFLGLGAVLIVADKKKERK